MPVLVSPPETLERGTLKFTKPELFTTSGLYQESKIELYLLKYNSTLQASVFIHPSRVILTPEKILALDGLFSNIEKRIIAREFKELSIEELSQHFLRLTKPLIPFMSPDYRLEQATIIEHSFPYESSILLKQIIEDLR